MKRISDLKILFTAIALLEFFYFFAAMLPPSFIRPVTGSELSADGHWIVKLMGVSLLTQAYIAWIFRKHPQIGVAKVLAFYHLASATMDWVMWLALKEEGIFSNSLAQTTVAIAIVSHYILGFLLVIAIDKASTPVLR